MRPIITIGCTANESLYPTNTGHMHRGWRRMNRKNMKLIGISEKEVLAFTDASADVAEDDVPEPDYSEFMKPHPDKDAIDSNLDYAQKLDSLLNHH